MPRLTTIELQKENFKFSAGHFTIFSATERENLHGHNWQLAVAITAEVGDRGLTFDYAVAKRLAETYCRELNERFLLPAQSPYLKVVEHETGVSATYGEDVLNFLKRDALVLPLRNITVEELSAFFCEKFRRDLEPRAELAVHAITVKVFSGPGQSASATWEKSVSPSAI